MWTPNKNAKEIWPVYVLDVARGLEKLHLMIQLLVKLLNYMVQKSFIP